MVSRRPPGADMDPTPTYSLFHQDLGVAFFQFVRSLFENFKQHFSQIIFSPSPNIPENVVDFVCVLAKLDHLACNNFSKWQLSLTPLPWNKNPITCQMV